jgi:Fe-S-cluster containining protein
MPVTGLVRAGLAKRNQPKHYGENMTGNNKAEAARQAQFKATLETLNRGTSGEQILSLVEEALNLASTQLEEARDENKPLACQAGCAYCCYLMATVSGPEALAIAYELRESNSNEELARLKARLRAAYQQTKKIDNLTRAKAGIPCPFLTGAGLCSIYAYRPLDCMTHHSLSREACEILLEVPDRGHPTNPSMQAMGAGLKTGLGQGLAEIGLEVPALRYELIEAIHLALNDERAMERYLAGKNVFKSAAIVIDPESRVSYKIKYAPPQLKKYARQVIALEQRQARQIGARRRKQST